MFKKITSNIINLLIVSIFILPFISNFNFGMIPNLSDYVPGVISTTILTLIVFFLVIQAISLKKPNLFKISYSQIILLIVILFFSLQFAITGSSYTAPYITIISLFLFITVFLNLTTNLSTLSFTTILTLASIGILVNCYYQIATSIIAITNTKLIFHSTFYSIDKPSVVLWQPFVLSSNRIGGGVAQANILADLLSWGIIANICLFNKKTKLSNLFFTFNLLIISIFIALTQSRTAFIYPILLMIYAIFLWKKNVTPTNNTLIKNLFISVFTLALTILIYQLYVHYNLSHELIKTTTNIEASRQNISDGQRIFMWGKAWMMFISHPIIGVGWQQYFQNLLITPQITFIHDAMHQAAVVFNCHNLILQLLATTGLIGTALFMVLIVYLFKNLLNLNIKEQLLPISVAIIVLTHSMFEYPLFNPAILIAVLTISSLADNNFILVKLQSKSKIIIFSSIFIIISSWQIFSGIHNYLLLSHAIKPKNYILNNTTNNILNLYFMTYNNPYWDDSSDAVLAINLMYTIRTPQNKKYFDLTYDALSRSTKFSPNPAFIIRLAIMDTAVGKDQEAQQLMHQLKSNYVGNDADFKEYIRSIATLAPQISNKLMLLTTESQLR